MDSKNVVCFTRYMWCCSSLPCWSNFMCWVFDVRQRNNNRLTPCLLHFSVVFHLFYFGTSKTFLFSGRFIPGANVSNFINSVWIRISFFSGSTDGLLRFWENEEGKSNSDINNDLFIFIRNKIWYFKALVWCNWILCLRSAV